MATIRSFTHWVPAKDGTREQKQVRIAYNPKGEYFYINLPEHLDTSSAMTKGSSYDGARAEDIHHRDGRIEGDSALEVERDFVFLCRRYYNSLRKSRKIIAYTLRWCRAGDFNREHNGLPFDDGTGLMVQWEKGWEVRLGKEEYKFFDHDPTDPENRGLVTGRTMSMVGREGVDNNGSILEWSQEREDFFIALELRMEKMIENARKFLDNPKALQLAIDAGAGVKMLEFKGGSK